MSLEIVMYHYVRPIRNSEYPNISETIIRPCMMVFVVVKFIMDMSRYERLMKKDLMKNDQGGMFRTLR